MTTNMRIVTHADRPELLAQVEEFQSDAFPTYMLMDRIWNEYWPQTLEAFPELQLYIVDEHDRVGGVLNAVALAWDTTIEDLPASEHDILIRSLREQSEGIAPNAIAGVQVIVHPDRAGERLASQLVAAGGGEAAARGYHSVIAAIRPNLKASYPTTPIESYITWTRDDGLPLDPWIRSQTQAGAQQLAVCRELMSFSGTVSQWEEWTGMALPETGTYVVEGALELLHIDREADDGTLGEPNVWFRYIVDPGNG